MFSNNSLGSSNAKRQCGLFSIFSFICVLSPSLSHKSDNLHRKVLATNKKHNFRALQEQAFDCLALKVDGLILNENNGTESDALARALEEPWYCEGLDDNTIYKIEGIPEIFFERNDVVSGVTTLKISAAIVKRATGEETENVIIVNADATIVTEQSIASLDRIGEYSMLIVRVSGNDVAPGDSAAKISSDWFTDSANLKSQYSACSNEQLVFSYSNSENSGAVGVYELTLSQNVAGQNKYTVEGWVTSALASNLQKGVDYDYIAYILPDSVNFGGAAAYAYINWHLSVFLNEYSSDLLVQMHEIGHNLGAYHSGEGSYSYGDGTCFMGAHIYQDDAPLMCFNGQKSYFFNWYSNIDVDPLTESKELKLVGANDYNNGQGTGNDYAVAVKLVNQNGLSLFLMYNREEGINDEVHKMGDKVTVVEGSVSSVASQSWLLAGLGAGEEYTKNDFGGSGQNLVIKVCEMVTGSPDYARTLIYMDGSNNPSCAANPIASPTDQPVAAPIVSPTDQPAATPSISPTESVGSEYWSIKRFDVVSKTRRNDKVKSFAKFKLKTTKNNLVENALIELSYASVNNQDQTSSQKSRSCTTNAKGKCFISIPAFHPDVVPSVKLNLKNIDGVDSGLIYDGMLNQLDSDDCPLFTVDCPDVIIDLQFS